MSLPAAENALPGVSALTRRVCSPCRISRLSPCALRASPSDLSNGHAIASIRRDRQPVCRFIARGSAARRAAGDEQLKLRPAPGRAFARRELAAQLAASAADPDWPTPNRLTSSRPYDAVQTSATHHEQAEMPVPPEPIGGGSQPRGDGMTLDEVTNIALANSPVIMEARNLAIAARGRALQASLYPNPTMGHASPQLAGNQSQYNAYVIQDLVTKNKIGLDTAAAERAAIAAEFALVRARFEVLTMVRQRFYTALAMQERIVVLERMVNIAQTALDVGQRLLKAEVGTRGDVLLLQIELSKSEADLKNFHALAETSRRQLSAATGLLNLQIDRVDGDLKQALPEFDLLSVQEGVLTRNADVARANVEVARNQFVLRRAEVEPFPNVNMMGGYQNQQRRRPWRRPCRASTNCRSSCRCGTAIKEISARRKPTISASVAQYNRVRMELANLTRGNAGSVLRGLAAGRAVRKGDPAQRRAGAEHYRTALSARAGRLSAVSGGTTGIARRQPGVHHCPARPLDLSRRRGQPATERTVPVS